MLFMRLLPLAIAAIGVWELRAIRKVHQARWDYDRLIKCANHEQALKQIPQDAKWFWDGFDKAAMDALGKPHDLPYEIQTPRSYFDRKVKRPMPSGKPATSEYEKNRRV